MTVLTPTRRPLTAGISIEEAPSMEMSPLELQVYNDRRHGQLGPHDNRQQISPRLQYQVRVGVLLCEMHGATAM